MIEVKKGDVFTEIKRGTTAKGDWFLATAKAEKGYDQISIWADNPSALPTDCFAVEVEDITAVRMSAKKGTDRSGKEAWFKTYSINAKLKAVSTGSQPIPDGFSLDDSEIPF